MYNSCSHWTMLTEQLDNLSLNIKVMASVSLPYTNWMDLCQIQYVSNYFVFMGRRNIPFLTTFSTTVIKVLLQPVNLLACFRDKPIVYTLMVTFSLFGIWVKHCFLIRLSCASTNAIAHALSGARERVTAL